MNRHSIKRPGLWGLDPIFGRAASEGLEKLGDKDKAGEEIAEAVRTGVEGTMDG